VQAFDLTILAGARPELLSRTLSSFQKNVFDKSPPKNVYVNIDPWGGDIPRDVSSCKRIIKDYFPNSFITVPKEANFAQAVKFLWALPESRQFLHLEDDWIAEKNILEFRPEKLLKGRITQVAFVRPPREQILFTKKKFRPKINYKRIFIPNLSFPCFTTSPSFLDSSFARTVADLIDNRLHPEKQMYNGLNIALEEYLRNFSIVSLHPWYASQSILDIGWEWQKNNGIMMNVIEGKLVYTQIDKSN